MCGHVRRFNGNTLVCWLIAFSPFVALAGLLIGPTFIPISALTELLSYAELASSQDVMILREIRLPRLILSALVGAVLAISGAVLQGLFRNPLADPSLIGISAGASVGASLAIMFGSAWLVKLGLGGLTGVSGLSIVAFGAFLGGAIAVILVYRLATGAQGTSVSTMLLVGIAISALAAATSNLLNFLADDEMLRRMSMWQMGNLDLANWPRVQICFGMLIAVLLLIRGQSVKLNAFLLGESEAHHMGISVNNVKKRLILLTALGVGFATAVAGTIAFVGLIVPHIVRILSGPNHRTLIPASGLLGAVLLILADLIARIVLAPAEIPVGVVTAFMGAPFFIYLLVQRRGRQS